MNLDRQIKKYMDEKMDTNVPNPYQKKRHKGLPVWAKICIPVTAVAMTVALVVPVVAKVIGSNLNYAMERIRGTYVNMENVKAFAICSADAKTKAPKLSKISRLNAPDSGEEPENPDSGSEGDDNESEYSWTDEELELYDWESDYDWDPTKANLLVSLDDQGNISEVVYERTNNRGQVRQSVLGNCVALYVSKSFTYAMYVDDSEYQFWVDINFAQELRYFNGFHCHHEEMQTIVIHNETGKVYALKDVIPQVSDISGAMNYTMQAHPTKDDFLYISPMYGNLAPQWYKVIYDDEIGVYYKFVLPEDASYRRIGVAKNDKYGQTFLSLQYYNWDYPYLLRLDDELPNCNYMVNLDDTFIFDQNGAYFGSDDRVYVFKDNQLKVFKEDFELVDVEPNLSVTFEGFANEFFDNGAENGSGFVFHFEEGYLYSMFGQVWKQNNEGVLEKYCNLEGKFAEYAKDGYMIGGEIIAIVNTHLVYNYSVDGELVQLKFGLKDGEPSYKSYKIMDASEISLYGHRMTILQDELPDMQRGPTKYFVLSVIDGRPYVNYIAYGDNGGMYGTANPITEPIIFTN